MSNWDLLRQKCPRLYKHNPAFDCSHGWFDVIHDLSIKIEKILDKNAEYNKILGEEESKIVEMFAVHVKEKYGTLRFYMSCATDEISDLIGDAEALSSQTCETCGAAGKMRGIRGFEVKCDKCYGENL